MVTYGDMVTLILTFFVLLFSLASLDATKFQKAAESLRGALGVLPGGPSLLETRPPDALVPAPSPEEPLSPEEERDRRDREQLEQLEQTALALLKQAGISSEVAVERHQRGLVLRFAANVLFESGKAELKPEALRIVDSVIPLLAGIPNEVRVEGHTDNVPIQTIQFPTNWELSTARATTVIRRFVEIHGLDPRRLSAAGYGEYRPLTGNGDEAGRQLNRRVDVVLMRLSWKDQEPDSAELKGGLNR